VAEALGGTGVTRCRCSFGCFAIALAQVGSFQGCVQRRGGLLAWFGGAPSIVHLGRALG
jgi:hypothetical protein